MIAAFTATIVLIAMLTYLDKFRKVVLWLAGFAIGLTAITFGGFYLDAHHYFEAGKPTAPPANVFDQFDTPPAAAQKPAKIADRQQPVPAPGSSLEQRIDEALRRARADGDGSTAIKPDVRPYNGSGLFSAPR